MSQKMWYTNIHVMEGSEVKERKDEGKILN